MKTIVTSLVDERFGENNALGRRLLRAEDEEAGSTPSFPPTLPFNSSC